MTREVLQGSLDDAALRYAGHAENQSALWVVWLEIQKALGRELEAALSELRPSQLRSFAWAALQSGYAEQGVQAGR